MFNLTVVLSRRLWSELSQWFRIPLVYKNKRVLSGSNVDNRTVLIIIEKTVRIFWYPTSYLMYLFFGRLVTGGRTFRLTVKRPEEKELEGLHEEHLEIYNCMTVRRLSREKRGEERRELMGVRETFNSVGQDTETRGRHKILEYLNTEEILEKRFEVCMEKTDNLSR